jgi:hypothetical protein
MVILTSVGFRIPGSLLACHPLVHTALSSLNSEILSEAAVNGIAVETSYIVQNYFGSLCNFILMTFHQFFFYFCKVLKIFGT